MLFTPQDRKRIKDVLLRRKPCSNEEIEAMVDSLLDLAVQLNKISGKHHSRRANLVPPQQK
ncbi:hypothetical protein A3E95_02205 [Candidatus Nomurabacteria bacterium RIFCSPHIGHO2_12_FULL_44_22b]|nr:MAG: hypothetical protein A3E95_02205 [Candidatus Nomurabacteria bacterium RIFCSPHIGHO2_12_FULL_44_22b]